MENDKNEPKTNEKTPQETVKVPILGTVTTGFPDYKKLSDKLRQDMRDASEELLSLRHQMMALINADTGNINGYLVCKSSLWEIDRALAFLDCTDHLQAESDETDSEVQDA